MVPALALGAHAFHLSANDARGQQGTDFLEFEIVDSRPPVLSVEASACVWPPNHKPFVLSLGEDVRVTASDQCEGDVSSTARFVDAVSNEADDGVADGTTTADVVFSDNTVCIRAERAGNAAGRTYTITVEASDSAGNTGISTFEVAVPHSGAAHGCVNAQEVAACAL